MNITDSFLAKIIDPVLLIDHAYVLCCFPSESTTVHMGFDTDPQKLSRGKKKDACENHVSKKVNGEDLDFKMLIL